MKTLKNVLAVCAVVAVCLVSGRTYGMEILHDFSKSSSDGWYPDGMTLLEYDGKLYGTTELGGASDSRGWKYSTGTIFRINKDGTDFTLLHSFNHWDTTNGSFPEGGSVIETRGVFYGMTPSGGAGTGKRGTIYKINPDGSGFSVIYSFDYTSETGSRPKGDLTSYGGVLYGMASDSGGPTDGVIFRLNTDGSGYTVVHEFNDPTDGSEPYGTLRLGPDGKFYGMTYAGGENGCGTLFSFDPNENSFAVVRHFAESDGYNPDGSVTIGSDGTIYGLLDYDYGSVYKINPNGTGFTVLHAFDDVPDGYCPYMATLTLADDGRLYGTTIWGGTNDSGTIFSLNTDGTDYQILYNFGVAPESGEYPTGGLTYNNGLLYGTTRAGGNEGGGIIFSFPTFGLIEDTIGANYTEIPKLADLDPSEVTNLTDQLMALYFAGERGENPATLSLYGLKWEYFPESIAGYQPGHFYQDGDYYIFYLGSGIKGVLDGGGGGDVPEPSTLLLLLPFIGFGIRRMKRRSHE